MQPFHFSCPHCGAGLKTRDRLSVGRQVTCPDCGWPFLLLEGKDGLTTEKISPPPEAEASSGRPSLADQLRANRTLAAAIAILGITVLIVSGLLVRPWFQPAKPSTPITATKTTDSKPAVVEIKPQNAAPKALPKTLSEPEQRLKKIGDVVTKQADIEKAFPAGGERVASLAIDQWFGWQGRLADTLEPGANIPVVYDRGWRDPLNEAFVRRRIAAWQNPAVARLTGDDGYPASHFAGVAGVGEDAAKLPADDPRAGAFGFGRQTRLHEVRDGLTNTMLVAGVQDKLGSWAAAISTVRPFTQPPYINGPDGFGSGQADGMLVLMADGRVVTLSAKTDPAIVRKLAAIADETSRQAPPPVIAKGPDDQPIEPLHVEDPVLPPELEVVAAPKVRSVQQIEASLQQRIAAYTFPPKTAVRLNVLREVAELTGVPLFLDELGESRRKLDEPIGSPQAPTLTDTTVRGILVALLDPVNLTFQVEPGRLRLMRKPNP